MVNDLLVGRTTHGLRMYDEDDIAGVHDRISVLYGTTIYGLKSK